MGWRGPYAGHEGQHVQAASHHQGGGEEEEDSEDEPNSGHPVHGMLAPVPCLLHTRLLSTRYASFYQVRFCNPGMRVATIFHFISVLKLYFDFCQP